PAEDRERAMASGAAKRYVQAIVEIARENQSFDVWERDLEALRQVAADEQFATFLQNPSVQSADKKKAIDIVLKDAAPETRNLAHLLIERQRAGLIPDIVEAFHEALLAERGIVVADVTTAEPLDETMQAEVRERDRKSTRLNSSHVKISYAVFCLKKKKNKAHYNLAYLPRYNLIHHTALDVPDMLTPQLDAKDTNNAQRRTRNPSHSLYSHNLIES